MPSPLEVDVNSEWSKMWADAWILAYERADVGRDDNNSNNAAPGGDPETITTAILEAFLLTQGIQPSDDTKKIPGYAEIHMSLHGFVAKGIKNKSLTTEKLESLATIIGSSLKEDFFREGKKCHFSTLSHNGRITFEEMMAPYFQNRRKFWANEKAAGILENAIATLIEKKRYTNPKRYNTDWRVLAKLRKELSGVFEKRAPLLPVNEDEMVAFESALQEHFSSKAYRFKLKDKSPYIEVQKEYKNELLEKNVTNAFIEHLGLGEKEKIFLHNYDTTLTNEDKEALLREAITYGYQGITQYMVRDMKPYRDNHTYARTKLALKFGYMDIVAFLYTYHAKKTGVLDIHLKERLSFLEDKNVSIREKEIFLRYFLISNEVWKEGKKECFIEAATQGYRAFIDFVLEADRQSYEWLGEAAKAAIGWNIDLAEVLCRRQEEKKDVSVPPSNTEESPPALYDLLKSIALTKEVKKLLVQYHFASTDEERKKCFIQAATYGDAMAMRYMASKEENYSQEVLMSALERAVGAISLEAVTFILELSKNDPFFKWNAFLYAIKKSRNIAVIEALKPEGSLAQLYQQKDFHQALIEASKERNHAAIGFLLPERSDFDASPEIQKTLMTIFIDQVERANRKLIQLFLVSFEWSPEQIARVLSKAGARENYLAAEIILSHPQAAIDYRAHTSLFKLVIESYTRTARNSRGEKVVDNLFFKIFFRSIEPGKLPSFAFEERQENVGVFNGRQGNAGSFVFEESEEYAEKKGYYCVITGTGHQRDECCLKRIQWEEIKKYYDGYMDYTGGTSELKVSLKRTLYLLLSWTMLNSNDCMHYAHEIRKSLYNSVEEKQLAELNSTLLNLLPKFMEYQVNKPEGVAFPPLIEALCSANHVPKGKIDIADLQKAIITLAREGLVKQEKIPEKQKLPVALKAISRGIESFADALGTLEFMQRNNNNSYDLLISTMRQFQQAAIEGDNRAFSDAKESVQTALSAFASLPPIVLRFKQALNTPQFDQTWQQNKERGKSVEEMLGVKQMAMFVA